MLLSVCSHIKNHLRRGSRVKLQGAQTVKQCGPLAAQFQMETPPLLRYFLQRSRH